MAPPTERSTTPRTPYSQAGCILIVDDDDEVRDSICALLQGTELRSVGVASAAEAFGVVKRMHPRAIVLDWVLPGGIGGMAILKALKATPSTKHIPVIMISGLRQSAVECLAAQHAGAEGLYDKAGVLSRREDFLSMLRAAVAKNKTPSCWRLLVVEDDEEVQGFIRFALARREFDVRFAGTGREGYKVAQEIRPNLIIMDMSLPDINGVEVCKLLRVNPATKGIPVLAMSGLDRAAGPLESALKEIGIDDYLPKPFGENEILQHMTSLLGRASSPRGAAEILVRGRVRLDAENRRVWVGERQIEHIGYKQFDLLHLLIKSAAGVSRTELQETLWNGVENSKALNMTVCRLRKVLGFGEGEGIIAIPRGYKVVG